MRTSSPPTGSLNTASGAGIGVRFSRATRSSNASCGLAPPKPHAVWFSAHAVKKRRSASSKPAACSRVASNVRFTHTSGSTGASSSSARVRPGNRLAYVAPMWAPCDRPM